MVDDLSGDTATGADTTGEQYMLAVQQLASVAGEYAKRIRLMTWALVAVIVYLILKETI